MLVTLKLLDIPRDPSENLKQLKSRSIHPMTIFIVQKVLG